MVFGDTDDHAEKGGLQKLGQVIYCRQTTMVVMKMTIIALQLIISVNGERLRAGDVRMGRWRRSHALA